MKRKKLALLLAKTFLMTLSAATVQAYESIAKRVLHRRTFRPPGYSVII